VLDCLGIDDVLVHVAELSLAHAYYYGLAVKLSSAREAEKRRRYS
jgi:hypothetical protein